MTRWVTGRLEFICRHPAKAIPPCHLWSSVAVDRLLLLGNQQVAPLTGEPRVVEFIEKGALAQRAELLIEQRATMADADRLVGGDGCHIFGEQLHHAEEDDEEGGGPEGRKQQPERVAAAGGSLCFEASGQATLTAAGKDLLKFAAEVSRSARVDLRLELVAGEGRRRRRWGAETMMGHGGGGGGCGGGGSAWPRELNSLVFGLMFYC